MTPSLTFSHRFASGREIVLNVLRYPAKRPIVTSSIQCAELSPAELAEYLPWRTVTVARLMSLLTPEEIFATNQPTTHPR